jgi:hypothetical protein
LQINSLLAGTLALVLVAGLGTPVFAQTNLSAGMDPVNVEGVANPQSVLSPQQVCSDIDYTFTGTGSGTLNGVPFPSSDFTVTVWANTCDVMEIFGPEVFTVLATAAEVDIDGVGIVQITEETGLFANNNNGALGWSFFDGNDLDSDIYDLFNVLPPAYDLTTDFGPLFDADPIGFFNPVVTDSGLLFITGITDGTFEAELKDMVVGGEFLPIDNTALMLAGLQSSAIWMIPTLAGLAGAGAFYIKSRMNKE